MRIKFPIRGLFGSNNMRTSTIGNNVAKSQALFLRVSIISLVLVFQIGCFQKDPCSYELKRSVKSPNGEYVASIYKVNCHATVDFQIIVFIEHVNSERRKKIFSGYHEKYVAVHWLSDEKLLLETDYDSNDLVTKVSKYNSISIECIIREEKPVEITKSKPMSYFESSVVTRYEEVDYFDYFQDNIASTSLFIDMKSIKRSFVVDSQASISQEGQILYFEGNVFQGVDGNSYSYRIFSNDEKTAYVIDERIHLLPSELEGSNNDKEIEKILFLDNSYNTGIKVTFSQGYSLEGCLISNSKRFALNVIDSTNKSKRNVLFILDQNVNQLMKIEGAPLILDGPIRNGIFEYSVKDLGESKQAQLFNLDHVKKLGQKVVSINSNSSIKYKFEAEPEKEDDIPYGTTLFVVEERDGWCKVKFQEYHSPAWVQRVDIRNYREYLRRVKENYAAKSDLLAPDLYNLAVHYKNINETSKFFEIHKYIILKYPMLEYTRFEYISTYGINSLWDLYYSKGKLGDEFTTEFKDFLKTLFKHDTRLVQSCAHYLLGNMYLEGNYITDALKEYEIVIYQYPNEEYGYMEAIGDYSAGKALEAMHRLLVDAKISDSYFKRVLNNIDDKNAGNILAWRKANYLKNIK
ncbi:hypothetical protein KAU32_07675 [bacterium]|nr:hypothetical protein [bacterium]